MKADLHCHSTHSDGDYSPESLLQMAKEIGLGAISISDHDTVSAYTKELFSLAQNLNIELVYGIEISSQLEDSSIHILGYGMNEEFSESSFLKEVKKRRRDRNLEIFTKLKGCGFSLSEEELKARFGADSLGRVHIAKMMVEKHFVPTFKEAFKNYLERGSPGYAMGKRLSVGEVIGGIQKYRGKAILAHPQLIKKTILLKQLFSFPFDGLELYYAKTAFDSRLEAVVKEKGWLYTGGSDFHGNSPSILGSSWLEDAPLRSLIQNRLGVLSPLIHL